MRIYPVIMCGGTGARLWPASTQSQPKQFHTLVTDQSVFQDTVLRLQDVAGIQISASPLIVSNVAYRDIIQHQLSEIGVTPLALLLEPSVKNTAAVAAIAAEYVRSLDPEGLVLLLPSDHHMSRPKAFYEAIAAALPVAAAGKIATFGITPDRPETGFGYIQAGAEISNGLYDVAAFREKPDLETAKTFLKDERFSWNAGIFLFQPERMLAELEAWAPDVLAPAIDALKAARREGASVYLEAAHFAKIGARSIDYAVMEHTQHAAVCAPVSCGWSDIGTWPVVGELQVRKPRVEPVLIDAENCLVHTEDDTLVAIVGLDDVVVVVVDRNVLVVPKSEAQNVRQIVAELEKRGLSDRV